MVAEDAVGSLQIHATAFLLAAYTEQVQSG
jgi:hypothetical protein